MNNLSLAKAVTTGRTRQTLFLYENDKLKYRIKEIEDRGLDRNSYENQIRDLQRRIDEMGSEIS